MLRVQTSQPGACGCGPAVVIPDELRQACSPADGLAVRDQGQAKVQPPQHGLSNSRGDRKQEEIGGSFARRSSEHSYRSCVHLQVPLRSSSSIVFLDKSLLISLEEVDGGRAEKHTFYRSTLSVRLGASSRSRFLTDYKPASTLEGYRKPGVALLDKSKDSCRRNRGLVDCGLEGLKAERTASTCRVKSRAGDSDSRCNSSALELLSHRRPSPLNADAGGQEGNADEAAFPTQSGFNRRTQPKTASETDSRGRSEHARSDKTEERQERDRSREPQKILISDASKTLSLKEALELFRPDFISRSQGRMRRLEQRAMKRRALRDSNPDLAQAHRDERYKQKRNCTTPDPLSDNLFKPRERSISGREMQLRSRRIYSKLPEVRKKKEAEKKRAVSQTNRLRVEVFKKRLLDQILQR